MMHTAVQEHVSSSMDARHRVQELRKHLVVLHNVQNQGTGPSMCAACAAIQSLIQDKPEAKQCDLIPSISVPLHLVYLWQYPSVHVTLPL